jgi:two-component system chemotaxis family response regulator WspR
VFDERLEELWERAIGEQRTLALLLMDVDHFKGYNDHYGHLAGDEVLRRIADALRAVVPGSVDLLARYGGEEFAAVLYDVRADRAERVAERMRRAVKALRIAHQGARSGANVTISIGLAVIRPVAGRSCRGALQLADEALYQAKLKGRDRIERADDAQYQLVVTGVFPSPAAAGPVAPASAHHNG